ncbi:MAG TPA: hypothetical protein VKY57_05430 [Chitinispirillaceae bacterium]|nr:hypothetical protein [Chitinispirillaceae bacterium]
MSKLYKHLFSFALIILLCILGVGSSDNEGNSTSSQEKTWYSGGTLHGAKMEDWSRASYDNRLATSADFVTKMMQMDGNKIPPVDQLKPIAQTLETAITNRNKDGIADNQDVSTIAATCWILINK